MAIQVNGTQVIGNSRELTNIASVDATTVAAMAAAGVGGGGSIELTATGSITAGDPVGVNSSGNAEKAASIIGPDVTLTTAAHASNTYLSDASCSISSSKTVFFYNKTNNTYVARCGVIQSDGSYSFGSETQIDSVKANSGHAGVCPDTGVICVFYKRDDGSSFETVAKAVTVTGTSTVNVGSSISHGAGNKNSHCVRPMGNSKFGLFNDSHASIVTTSGTSITKNSTVAGDDDIRAVAWNPDSSHFVLSYGGYGSNWRRYPVSGTTISKGTGRSIYTGGWDRLLGWYDTSSNYFVRVVQDAGGFKIEAWNVSSTDINNWAVSGTLVFDASSNDMWNNSWNLNQGVWNEGAGVGFVHYRKSAVWGIDQILVNAGGTPSVLDTTSAFQQTGLGEGNGITSTMYINGSTVVASYLNFGTPLASFIGFAESSVSNGQTVDITVDGGINSNQSGLEAGKSYGVNGSAVLTKGFKPQAGVALSATKLLVGNGRNTA